MICKCKSLLLRRRGRMTTSVSLNYILFCHQSSCYVCVSRLHTNILRVEHNNNNENKLKWFLFHFEVLKCFLLFYMNNRTKLFVTLLDNGMNDHRCTVATDLICDEIVEIAFNCPHIAFVAGKHLCRQSAIATFLHFEEIGWLEQRLSVPQINVALAFVSQKQWGTIVCAQQYDLLSTRFRSNIDDSTSTQSFAQQFRFNREQTGRTQVREIQ